MIAAAPFRLETCACPPCGEPPPPKTRSAFGPHRVMAPLLVRTFVRRLAPLPPREAGARLLDVGCGPGLYANSGSMFVTARRSRES